ncbi:MAG: pyrroline-5-carboxylate reductase [Rhodospirillaceae bacterium]|nr:pyrroline-5-carboxylate reductase [Rhodospirillaceae bacterium]
MRDLLLIGCGKMGGAMLSGWRRAAVADRYLVVEPNTDVPRLSGVYPVTDFDALPPDTRPGVVVLAVKPQVMDEVIYPYRSFAKSSTVFLSIAAGKPVDYFLDRLGAGARVVRAMPNTPAAISKGVSVLFAGPGVTPEQKALCSGLLSAVGAVEWLEDEDLIDVVTAVSGGGPAYVFLLIEALAKAGEAAGLPADIAMRLARGTVIGAGALAEQSREAADELRQNVTSPGGTTAAALAELMDGDALTELLTRAVAAAAARSRELAG